MTLSRSPLIPSLLLLPSLLLAAACGRQEPPAPPPQPQGPESGAAKGVFPPVAELRTQPAPDVGVQPEGVRPQAPPRQFAPPSAKPIVYSEKGNPGKQEQARPPGELVSFHGFSQDGGQFAYAAFSEGAGFPILHVVSSASSEQVKDFQLGGAAGISQAQAYLGTGRFVSAEIEPPARLGARKVEVSMQGQTASVKLDGKLLWSGNPFGSAVPGGGTPRAYVVGWSPDGKKVAVRADVFVSKDFGRATGVRIVEVPE